MEGRGAGDGCDEEFAAHSENPMPYSSPLRTADSQSRPRPANRCCGSLTEILDELLRIAHRADAYEIHVETFDYEGRPVLSVNDNGSGIESPRDLLALDAIGWRESVSRPGNDDAIALSSLAGRHVIVRSGPDETVRGWSATIPAEAWNSAAPITIEPDGGLRGTNFIVEIPVAWRVELEDAVTAAARHLPVRVYFHARWTNRP